MGVTRPLRNRQTERIGSLTTFRSSRMNTDGRRIGKKQREVGVEAVVEAGRRKGAEAGAVVEIRRRKRTKIEVVVAVEVLKSQRRKRRIKIGVGVKRKKLKKKRSVKERRRKAKCLTKK